MTMGKGWDMWSGTFPPGPTSSLHRQMVLILSVIYWFNFCFHDRVERRAECFLTDGLCVRLSGLSEERARPEQTRAGRSWSDHGLRDSPLAHGLSRGVEVIWSLWVLTGGLWRPFTCAVRMPAFRRLATSPWTAPVCFVFTWVLPSPFLARANEQRSHAVGCRRNSS